MSSFPSPSTASNRAPVPASLPTACCSFAHTFQRAGGGVTLHPELATQQARTVAIASVLQQVRTEGSMAGWRDELYPVVRSFHNEPA